MSRAYQRNAIRSYPEGQTDLAGGLNDKINESLLGPGETPECLNVDYDPGAVKSSQGAIKFNNQVAPGTCIRTKVDRALTELQILAAPLSGTGAAATGACGVPLRGYGYLPYSEDTDVGGRSTYEGAAYDSTESFHGRRGRSFELDVSFRIPPEELLYATPTIGAASATHGTVALNPPHGFDEALDECFIALQKGGDRTAPMSWAIGVVNIGNGAGMTHLPYPRVSNYALVFMWYDAPQFGQSAGALMRYSITSAVDPVATGFSCTNALRAVVIHKYVEPGKRYSVAVQLAMDTGSPGGVASNTAWIGDGKFTVHVSEDAGAPTTYSYVEATGVAIGLEVYKGPTDSLAYLCKYGVRYFGRDAMFIGLGYRFAPWMRMGFIPFGMDSAPLGSGGFQMLDCSTADPAAIYGGGGLYTLSATHVPNQAFVTVNNAFLDDGIGNMNLDPKGTSFGAWEGLSALRRNPEALRGYRFVAAGDGTWGADLRGAVMSILDVNDPATGLQFNVLGGDTDTFATAGFGGGSVFIRAFRWHQRDLEIGQIKIYGSARDFASADALAAARRKLSLHGSVDLNDEVELDLDKLIAYWPCDDADGGLIREMVMGGTRNGFLCPLGNVTTEGGSRGSRMVFLSGEGEAISLDLSENPVFRREVKRMLQSDGQGFGFEITFVPTEAFYAIGVSEALADVQGSDSGGGATGAGSGYRGRLVPDLVVWDTKDSDEESFRVDPRPLLSLTHRNHHNDNDLRPFRWPLGPSVEVARASDQENQDVVCMPALQQWYTLTAGRAEREGRYDTSAPWVGRSVTIQVGVQRAATADVYDVYIALSPKDAWRPQSGDPTDAEVQFWTSNETDTTGGGTYLANYYSGRAAYNGGALGHVTIRRKDLERSVLTIGGRWNPKAKSGDTTNLGLWEMGARMLVDEVRWFVGMPSGALASYSSGFAVATLRNGKLEGANSLPQRELDVDDIFRRLGPSADTVDVTEGSATITPAAGTAFFPAQPDDDVNSPYGSMVAIDGDVVSVSTSETESKDYRDVYFAPSSTATAISLGTNYRGPTREGALARHFRLAGYTSFADDVRDKQLLLGSGNGYAAAAGGTGVSDVTLTDGLWVNRGGFDGDWKLRIYSPLGPAGLADLFPNWTRGLVTERRIEDDGILGLHSINSKLYVGVRGSLYEGDDRWRTDGPSDAIPSSLAFRSAPIGSGYLAPLHDDRVVFESSTNTKFLASTTDAYAAVYDARVKLDSIGELQTILWIGDTSADQSQPQQTTVTTSGTGTTFTTTTGVDGAAWGNLSLVRQGDLASAGGFTGVITAVSNAAGTPYEIALAANTVRVAAWTNSSGTGTPASGSAISIIRQGNRTHVWLRLNRGRPELCLGSNAVYSGTSKPDKGLYCVTARQALEVGRWYHIRFYVPTRSSGTIITTPFCKIGGKSVAVSVNATESGVAAGDWLNTAGVVYFNTSKIALGAAHDDVQQPQAAQAFLQNSRLGDGIPGSRLRGWLHSLNGRLAQVVIARVPGTYTSAPADFDPNTASFNVAGVVLQFETLTENLGVGHKIIDAAGQQAGVIYSHPFVSVFHGMGRSRDPFVFAEYAAQLYATNGGKPVVVLADGSAKLAGVSSPSTELDFETARFPLWAKNARSNNSDANSPVAAAATGAAQEQYHYDTRGNAFLSQRIQASDNRWSSGKYAIFKCFVRPRRTDGRSRIWGRGAGAAGGPFLDCVDGRARFGWYDVDLKREVYVDSGDKVFFPGRVHYVNLRKLFPPNNGTEGNWLTSCFSNGQLRRVTLTVPYGTPGTFVVGEEVTYDGGASSGIVVRSYGASAATVDIMWYFGTVPSDIETYTGVTSGAIATSTAAIRPMYDVLNVRNFRTTAEVAAATRGENLALIDSTFTSFVAGTNQSVRNGAVSTSLTPDTLTIPTGCSASGLVSAPGMTFYGVNPTGLIRARRIGIHAGNVPYFHPSMVGMYFVWGSSAPVAFAGKRYRITLVGAANDGPSEDITVAAVEAGDTIAFNGIVVGAPVAGGVFWGQALKKSDDFDASRTPDSGAANIYLGGQPDQSLLDSGFTPFDGEIWCPAWGVVTPAAALTNGQCFETVDSSAASAVADVDPITVGMDAFSVENETLAASAPGPLRCDLLRQFFAADVQLYSGSTPTTTAPNVDLKVARSTAPTVTGGSSADLFWEYLQLPSEWSKTRYYAVAIYDKRQGIVSNVGPRRRVTALAEDGINPSGAVRITLSRLPVGGKDTEVWVYSSVAGGSDAALFRVAKVERGTFSVAIQKRDDEIATAAELGNFANWEPPRCSLLAVIGSRMVYAALEQQPDGCMPSRAGAAGLVDAAKLFRMPGGVGEKITRLDGLDALGLIHKRRALGTFTFTPEGFADVREISGAQGAVGPNAAVTHGNMLFFLSDKGVMVAARGSGSDLAQPHYVGVRAEKFITSGLDRKRLTRAFAVFNRRLHQVIWSLRGSDRNRFDMRLSVQLDAADQRPVFSKHQLPSVTAMASIQVADGGIERLVGGTEEGFLVWLDDTRTSMVMLGPAMQVWGYPRVTSTAASSGNGISLGVAGQMDSSLEGPRGATIAWTDGDGVDREALVLGADASAIHFAEVLPAPIPAGTLSVGARRITWETAWIDMGNPERSKLLHYVDLMFKQEQSGELEWSLYVDRNIAQPRASGTLDLTQLDHVLAPEGVGGFRFKLVLKSPAIESDLRFELAQLVWRVSDEGQE